MIDYMDYVLRQFERCTSWNNDNSYENIVGTSRNILQFDVPEALKVQVNNKSTPYSYNTLEITNNKTINGSLSYLYTNCENLGQFVDGSTSVRLQQMTQSFRYIEPYYHHYKSNGKSQVPKVPTSPIYLVYGRMLYPSSTLEAMYVKRFSRNYQLMLKCLSAKTGPSILTMYLQKNTGANCQELILSTNEALLGYRFVHNFVSAGSKSNLSLYNNSSLSIGSELWCALLNLSPGCSTTLRYCSHATNTGKPLIFTLSLNPLYGHVSSTYSIKTHENLTFSTKYDFNIYSIQSNLTLGMELWKYRFGQRGKNVQQQEQDQLGSEQALASESIDDWSQITTHDKTPMYYHLLSQTEKSSHSSQKLLQDLNLTFQSSLQKIDKEREVIESFNDRYNEADFTQVFKASTSLRDRSLRFLWEGKIKGFLISAGVELTQPPEIAINGLDSLEHQNWTLISPSKFGIQLQYSA
ncbi:hypothetical protein KMAR_20334 [Kluyveromyces marxianus]|nr:protein MDM10 [Kluyveromyces marxianus]BAP70346.1 hypothetical protein KMAR_20334 [Kluyveromyces marxianus]